jgi:uncharacterized protein YuzB (UPF0349 family)
MKIRFCENNEGSAKVCKQLKKEFPEFNIKRKDCIKSCSICKKSPFALVQDKVIKADDSDELYGKIIAILGKS